MNEKKSKTKALVLLSGGLDSMLAAKVLMEQGVEVTGITFISCFFGAKKARKAAQQLGIKLIEIDFKEEHLAMLKNPKYGYGKNMNPCIDCHSLMLRHAKKYLTPPPPLKGEDKKEGYDFIATGEILGQRPMSQNREALKTVAQYSGVGDKLVRPLSAKLMEETAPEKEGKIIREKLLDISGRIRERQIELAKKFNIKDYPSPAGGCLLTDPEFSQRLIKMLNNWPDCNVEDVELLKLGRIFWIKQKDELYVIITIGRNKEECEQLFKLKDKGDVIIEMKGLTGPTVLTRFPVENRTEIKNIPLFYEQEIKKNLNIKDLKLDSKMNPTEIIEAACALAGCFAPKAKGKKVIFNINI